MVRTFEESYKTIRNKARRYNPDVLLFALLREMQSLPDSGLDMVKAAPWQMMLLAKWVCQDEMVNGSSRWLITSEELRDLRNDLWNLSGGLPDEGGITLFMRRLIRPQLAFQRGTNMSFIRDLEYLRALPNTGRLRRAFEEITNVDVEAFVDLSIGVVSLVVLGKKKIKRGDLSPFESRYGSNAVTAYIRCISATWSELKNFCRKLPDAKKKVASELYEWPAISRYPFIRIGNSLHSWHPAVCYRGMDNILHNVMSVSTMNYMEAYGRSFERHVVKVINQLQCEIVTESELRSAAADLESCDCVLFIESAQVLVEVKSSIFPEDVLVAGDRDFFVRNTRQLQKAIRQGLSTIDALKNGPWNKGARKTFLLVVVNKSIGVIDGERLTSMFPPNFSEKLDQDAQLPLSHVFFLNVDELERLIDSVLSGSIDLPNFFECSVRDNQDRSTSVYDFSQLLERYGARGSVSAYLKELQESALERIGTYMN